MNHVSEVNMQEFAWFKAIDEQLKSGGPLNPPTPVFKHPGSVTEFEHLSEEIHLVHFQHSSE
jgi:hypothetical protein